MRAAQVQSEVNQLRVCLQPSVASATSRLADWLRDEALASGLQQAAIVAAPPRWSAVRVSDVAQ